MRNHYMTTLKFYKPRVFNLNSFDRLKKIIVQLYTFLCTECPHLECTTQQDSHCARKPAYTAVVLQP